MNQDFSSPGVAVKRQGNLGVITLNNPRSLNALSLDMIRQIVGALKKFERDDHVTAVYFRGNGGRAFCAGGDVKSFYRAGMDFRRGLVNSRVPAIYFGEEYAMNRQLFHYSKPTISFMNGIVMGGGFGIAGNCRFRVTCEKTLFAMPEVGIGFFPDVGSMYHLLRCPGRLGYYLSLTGARLGPADVLQAGIAQMHIPEHAEADLLQALSASNSPQDIEKTLHAKAVPPAEPATLASQGGAIAKIFAAAQCADILQGLADEGTDFAKETLDLIKTRSPTSVLVTAEYLRRGAAMDFDEIIRTDFNLAQRFLARHDLYEGVRAAVIDKDRNPRWNPASFGDVTADDIAWYFTPTGLDLDNIHIFAA